MPKIELTKTLSSEEIFQLLGEKLKSYGDLRVGKRLSGKALTEYSIDKLIERKHVTGEIKEEWIEVYSISDEKGYGLMPGDKHTAITLFPHTHTPRKEELEGYVRKRLEEAQIGTIYDVA